MYYVMFNMTSVNEIVLLYIQTVNLKCYNCIYYMKAGIFTIHFTDLFI